ncbi:hypothetical protein D3C86_1821140 [compost metagenome]
MRMTYRNGKFATSLVLPELLHATRQTPRSTGPGPCFLAGRPGPENRTDGLHRAGNRPAQGLPGGVQQGAPRHRHQVGARLHRRGHGQAAGGKSQPAGRRDLGRGRIQPGPVRPQ